MEIPANSPADFSPLRSIADIEELEHVPLEQRVLSWDANDWIRRGLDLAPDKIAIQYVADGKPDTRPVETTYRELKQRAVATANLFRTLGVGDHDAVLYLMPTIPALYTVMLASLAVGVSCCVNWMLEPAHWIGLIKSSGAKLVVVLGLHRVTRFGKNFRRSEANCRTACGSRRCRCRATNHPSSMWICWRRANRATSSFFHGDQNLTISRPICILGAQPDRQSWSSSPIAAFATNSGPIR